MCVCVQHSLQLLFLFVPRIPPDARTLDLLHISGLAPTRAVQKQILDESVSSSNSSSRDSSRSNSFESLVEAKNVVEMRRVLANNQEKIHRDR